MRASAREGGACRQAECSLDPWHLAADRARIELASAAPRDAKGPMATLLKSGGGA